MKSRTVLVRRGLWSNDTNHGPRILLMDGELWCMMLIGAMMVLFS
jgi:hypothetical protein